MLHILSERYVNALHWSLNLLRKRHIVFFPEIKKRSSSYSSHFSTSIPSSTRCSSMEVFSLKPLKRSCIKIQNSIDAGSNPDAKREYPSCVCTIKKSLFRQIIKLGKTSENFYAKTRGFSNCFNKKRIFFEKSLDVFRIFFYFIIQRQKNPYILENIFLYIQSLKSIFIQNNNISKAIS